MKFSPSKIRTRLTCELKASFVYDHGLVPIRSSKKYDAGKYAHALLEVALYRQHHGYTPEISDQQAKLTYTKLQSDENVDLEETDAIATLESVRETLVWMDLDNWETVTMPGGLPAVELGGTVPWLGHELDFRIDWIAKSKRTGLTYIIDHKTTRGNLDGVNGFVEFDIQLALYKEAAKELGIHVDGAMLNMIGIPKRAAPDTLKSGALSRNKSKCSTRWSLYERAVIDAGLDPREYADMKEHLQDRTWNMWRPDKTSDTGHSRLLKHVREGLYRMENEATPIASRNPYDCEWCEYRPLCDATLDGQSLAPFVGVVYKAKNEQSPWHDKESFDEAGLSEYFARGQNTGRFDTSSFVP